MNNCPFCGAPLNEGDTQCPLCLKDLPEAVQKSSQPKWFFKKSSLIVGFLFVGPFILPVVWLNPNYSRFKKIWISSIMLVITIILCIVLKQSLNSIREYYELLQVY